ncbi:hypothetical protein [Nocardioides convexus]|uniref:hypothetical protein n=1 Tax=Nocardioides convexus TaxID=2712224 RepID=UPI0024183C11|nr:hypothetical protein [Nocardioides convexus]
MAVRTAEEPIAAAATPGVRIEVEGTVTGIPSITLLPGTTVHGGTLVFGARGVRLTRDNALEGVTISAPAYETAVCNDTSYDDLGTLRLHDVTTRGQVILLAEGAVRTGEIRIEGLHVEAARLAGREQRPRALGVDAHQGGLTVWNRQHDPDVVLSAEILDVSAGSAQEPIGGSGVLVGGRTEVSRLTTGEIHTHGRIPAGTPDLVSGGVLVITGARVGAVVNGGPVTTYGQSDMVLLNGGTVETWTVLAPVTSHGPGGSGFVNLGELTTLDVQAPVQTHGAGARGFDLRDGTLGSARFASIRTTGDGSAGIRVSRPMGEPGGGLRRVDLRRGGAEPRRGRAAHALRRGAEHPGGRPGRAGPGRRADRDRGRRRGHRGDRGRAGPPRRRRRGVGHRPWQRRRARGCRRAGPHRPGGRGGPRPGDRALTLSGPRRQCARGRDERGRGGLLVDRAGEEHRGDGKVGLAAPGERQGRRAGGAGRRWCGPRRAPAAPCRTRRARAGRSRRRRGPGPTRSPRAGRSWAGRRVVARTARPPPGGGRAPRGPPWRRCARRARPAPGGRTRRGSAARAGPAAAARARRGSPGRRPGRPCRGPRGCAAGGRRWTG